jgi:Asp-tRNA(Asn)/Glu-tRNA(Gln) amidotransferase A subunit family amidase
VRFRAWFRAECLKALAGCDVLIAPATNDVAPPIDAPFVTFEGRRTLARANLRLLTG